MTKKEQRRAARDYAAICIADARSRFLLWVELFYAHDQDDPPELTDKQQRAATRAWVQAQAQADELKVELTDKQWRAATRVWAQAQADELKAVLAES